MKTILTALFVVLASTAIAGSPDFNRSLYVCSAVYSDGSPTYEHCKDVSDEEKLEDIENSLYDEIGGGDDDGDNDSDGDE